MHIFTRLQTAKYRYVSLQLHRSKTLTNVYHILHILP